MRSRDLKRSPVPQAGAPLPGNNEQMGQRKLLETQPYERRMTKTKYELFPSSYGAVKFFIEDKERMLLQSAREIARTMLYSGNFVPGEYKLIFNPVAGGRAAFLYESLVHTDRVGLMLMAGTHNGEEVRVVEMRSKKDISIAQKGLELELGEPRMKAMMCSTTVSDALSRLHAALGDPAVCPKKKEKLSALLSLLEAEHHGQERMFYEACAGSPEVAAKAKSILAKISAAVAAAEAAKQHLAKSEEQADDGAERAGAIGKARDIISSLAGDADRKISIAAHVGALDSWPLLRGQGAIGAEAFYDALSPGSRALLGYISNVYITDVLPGSTGVAPLEQSSMDSIGQLQNLLRLIHAKTQPSKEGPLLEKISAMDSSFIKIYGLADGIAHEVNEAAAQAGQGTPRQAFLRLCGFMETRRKLLAELRTLEKIADGLEHEAPYRAQAKKIISNMAFNLCRVGKGEYGLIDRFISDRPVQTELRKIGAYDRLRGFVSAAKQECERAEQRLQGAGGKQKGTENRTLYKNEKAKADEEIHAQILELKRLVPSLGNMLLSDYRRSKAHVGYKQGETISQSPENHLTRLRIAQALHEATGKEEYAAARDRYLDEASELFTLLWGSHASRTCILDTIKPFLRLQEKGFDLVGTPEKHIANGNTHKEIVVDYRLRFEHGDEAISFTYDGKEHVLRAGAASMHDIGELPLGPGESERDVRTDIYGRRISLTELLPPESARGPYEMFRGLYLVASADAEKFASIRKDMEGRNMENARFLSTLASSRHRHSGNMAKFGSVLVENLPLKADASSQNSLEAYLGMPAHYPDFAQSAKEAKDFTRQQAARRLVSALAVNKWGFVVRYIEGVLAEKGAT